ncbi:hypothetical protein FHR83_003465 [Actinoplanes campanulatus]|uniref:Uncharacterized protein n=1 Tax=Actinoplanes campanulatus TaxID=113559 RepID=A0A7W5AGT3_9ACTN|nr:hypothetical protein [Actinoplanes campanulatus]MBB3095795.1 hypothetical protein [Actinoplanes campanulatus]
MSQIATAWAFPNAVTPADTDHTAFMDARRAAIVAAVQRLFPAADSSSTSTPNP